MNRFAIEFVLAELVAQQDTEPGESRTQAIEAILAKLNKLAPANIDHTVETGRQFIHSSDQCDIRITIKPGVFNLFVSWN